MSLYYILKLITDQLAQIKYYLQNILIKIYTLMQNDLFTKIIQLFFGDLDDLLKSLIIFTIIELLTTTLLLLFEHKFSIQVVVKELIKKFIIVLLISIGHVIDAYIINFDNSFRTIIIWFYISHEGITILENAVSFHIPVPKVLKQFLVNLHNKANDDT